MSPESIDCSIQLNSFCSNFRNFITVVNCGFKSDVIHGQAYRERETVYSQAGTRNGLGLHNHEDGWPQAESLRAEGIDDLLNVLPLFPGLLCLYWLFMSESGRQEIDWNFAITVILLIVLMFA